VINEGTQKRLDDARHELEVAADTPALLTLDPQQLADDWEALDLDTKRRHLASIVQSVSISAVAKARDFNPARVEVQWRF
jgi:hypothetical protein